MVDFPRVCQAGPHWCASVAHTTRRLPRGERQGELHERIQYSDDTCEAVARNDGIEDAGVMVRMNQMLRSRRRSRVVEICVALTTRPRRDGFAALRHDGRVIGTASSPKIGNPASLCKNLIGS
jgi:guanylate kinase